MKIQTSFRKHIFSSSEHTISFQKSDAANLGTDEHKPILGAGWNRKSWSPHCELRFKFWGLINSFSGDPWIKFAAAISPLILTVKQKILKIYLVCLRCETCQIHCVKFFSSASSFLKFSIQSILSARWQNQLCLFSNYLLQHKQYENTQDCCFNVPSMQLVNSRKHVETYPFH